MSTYFTTHWAEPEPEIVAQRLMTLAEELEDMQEPMALAGVISRADIQENFATGTDPSGQAWAGWSEEYEPWALTHSTGPIFGDRANLHLYGDLQDAIGSPSAFLATDEGLFLDTSGLPEYWAWNNFGAERATSDSRESNIAFRKANRGRGLKPFGALHGENYLPERPFIGISPEAQAKMHAVFALWFTGEVSVAMSGKGSKLRGKGGRFVKMS